MIQANELRIGNAMYCKYRQGIYLVKEIAEMWLRIADPKGGYLYSESYETVLPIPLTPELLEACGFVKSEHRLNAFEKETRLTIRIDESNYSACFNEHSYDGVSESFIRFRTNYDDIIWFHDFKYFHQLQNAIFLLTNSELEVNIEKVKA